MTTPDLNPSTPDAARAWRVWQLIRNHRNTFDMSAWFIVGWHDPAATTTGPYGLDLLTATRPTDADGYDYCETTACLAGWTVAEAGYRVGMLGYVYHPDGRPVFSPDENEAFTQLGWGEVAELAARLLNIDEDTANELFINSGEDDLEDTLTRVFGPEPEEARP